MEHRTILGGEQFLPFARSRIKALKALGLPYANQSFEVDGVSIKVRIEPGHEYIRIEGGVSLYLDSGVMYHTNVGVNVPTRFAPGILYEPDHVRAYNLPFVKTGTSSIRLNPNPGSNGQLSGILKHQGRFVGAIGDKALSFFPKKTVVDGDEVVSEDDENLYIKKLITTICPASIFTGKCRLYVQAMYGLPLYESGRQDKLLADQPRLGVPQGDIPPYLILPSRKPGGRAVDLTTSSGVYLDKETGKHWLFLLGGDAMMVYPLISSPQGESLRKFLKESNQTLNAVDKEHLEAYILAYSLPDTSQEQAAVGTSGFVGAYSMGYGWHWNWSGTECVIVHNNESLLNEEMEFSPGNPPVMRSTAYKISVGHSVSDGESGPIHTWAAQAVVTEGPVVWAVSRIFWCIAAPNWLINGLTKITPKYNTPVFPCDAPFYAFYTGDTLKMCRIKIVRHDPEPPKRELSSPLFGEPGYGSAVTEYTLGLYGGYYVENASFIPYYTCSLSCGSFSINDLYLGRSYAEQKVEISAKVQGETPGPEGQFIAPPATTRDYEFGYPYADGRYDKVSYENAMGVNGVAVPVYYDRTFDETGGHYSSVAAVAVPLMDSEAAFFYGRAQHIRGTNRTTTALTGYMFCRVFIPQIAESIDGVGVFYWGTPTPPKYTISGPYSENPTIRSVSTSEHNTVEVLYEKTTLCCSSNELTVPYPALLPLLADAHSDDVSLILSCLSNAKGSRESIVVSPSLVATGTDFYQTPFSIIGWA